MNKKNLIVLLSLFVLAGSAFGQGRKYYHIQFVDEWNDAKTDLSSVTISTSAGGTATLYTTQAGSTEYGSSGVISSGLSDGAIEFWYEDTTIDVSASDGSYTRTVDDMSVLTTRIQWPSYLAETSTTSYGQNADIDFTYANFIIDGDTSNVLDITPDNDDAAVNIGSASKTCDLNMYGGTSGYNLYWDASENTLELLDNAVLAVGTGDDWTVSHNGSTTTITGAFTCSGIPTFSTDATFDGTYDAMWDDSENTFIFKDNAVLGFGNDGATPDVELTWDTDSLNLTAAAIDTPWEIGGTTYGFDITYAFEGAGNIFIDYDGDFLTFTDDMDLRFGTGAGTNNGDFQISSNSSNVLNIGQVVPDTGTMTIGADDHDIPFIWYAETSGAEVTGTGDGWTFDGVDITVNDDDIINFGDSAEVTMQYDEDGLDALQITGPLYGYRMVIENVTANDTLTTAESGRIFVVDGNTADVTLTLPSVGATDEGVWYVIVDANETAASDVSLVHSDSDTINGSANDFSSDGADELPCALMVIYNHDNTDWVCLPMQLSTAWDSE
jgi:hypothetical protein